MRPYPSQTKARPLTRKTGRQNRLSDERFCPDNTRQTAANVYFGLIQRGKNDIMNSSIVVWKTGDSFRFEGL